MLDAQTNNIPVDLPTVVVKAKPVKTAQADVKAVDAVPTKPTPSVITDATSTLVNTAHKTADYVSSHPDIFGAGILAALAVSFLIYRVIG